MANDIDMLNDIENEKDGSKQKLLLKCYNSRYITFDGKAEELKNKFIDLYGYWGNFY